MAVLEFWQTKERKSRLPVSWTGCWVVESNRPSRLQVIYRALPPSSQVDPFGAAAQHQLMLTNLRLRLLQPQPCPCRATQPGGAALPSQHYAIYDFILKGSCLCHGHAEQCVPAPGSKGGLEKSHSMVRHSWLLLHACSYVQLALQAAAQAGSERFTHHYRDLRLWKTLITALARSLMIRLCCVIVRTDNAQTFVFSQRGAGGAWPVDGQVEAAHWGCSGAKVTLKQDVFTSRRLLVLLPSTKEVKKNQNAVF